MKENREVQGRFTAQARGLGTVSEEMVRARARELALINGRSEDQVLVSDLKQARRELLGEEGLHPPLTAEEALTEDQRWEPVPESEHKRGAKIPASDEQTFAEKLVEEGLQDAEQDQMVRATRASIKKNEP